MVSKKAPKKTKVEMFLALRARLGLAEGSGTGTQKTGQGYTKAIAGFHGKKLGKKAKAQQAKAARLNRTARSARKRGRN